MTYYFAKGLHIVAVLIWMLGTLGTPLVLGLLGTDATQAQRSHVRAFIGRIITPTMLTAFVAGVWLMVTGGWFPTVRMQLKLVAVICMTAVHGMLSGKLRQYASAGRMHNVPSLATILISSLILMSVITFLVSTKAAPW